MLSDKQIALNKGTLMGASVRIQERIKGFDKTESNTGAKLIALFLDEILRENCSIDVVNVFLEEIRK